MALHPVLNEKLNTAVLPVPQLLATHRDAVLPAVPGKVHAVIGMRRAGKTTFLRQLQAEWRNSIPPERVEVVVSGSSAKMLSREVHTSLRGRGMETVIRPFSFREFMRHRGTEPARHVHEFTAVDRSLIEKEFREYLALGGVPEALGVAG